MLYSYLSFRPWCAYNDDNVDFIIPSWYQSNPHKIFQEMDGISDIDWRISFPFFTLCTRQYPWYAIGPHVRRHVEVPGN